MKAKLFLCTIVSLIIVSCEKADDVKPIPYLNQWIGNYEGTSHHWSSQPTEINGQWQVITNEAYRKVSVDISIGEQDSCLTFNIIYEDTILDTKENLLFSNLGVHLSEWGGSGSGYGSLNISFKSDSLYYDNFQKCGIPCDSGIDFDIAKK